MDITDIVNINLKDSELVSVENYDIFRTKKSFGFKAYGMTLNLHMHSQGKEQIQYLEIEYGSGKTETFPIGTWVFDIGEADCQLLDTWQSTGASSNPQAFAFSYKIKDENVHVQSIQYALEGFERKIQEQEGFVNGTIALDNDAPMNYIKARIWVKAEGMDLVSYGKGSYCGALGVTKETILKSREHFSDLK